MKISEEVFLDGISDKYSLSENDSKFKAFGEFLIYSIFYK